MSAIEERKKVKTPIEAGPSEPTVAETAEADWGAIGVRLREIREAAGVSQRQLGLRLGRDRSAIQKLEAGKLIPSVQLVEAITSEFGFTAADVFPEPNRCGCGCGGLTFARFLPGHAPGTGTPIAERKDRENRDEAGTRLREARIALGLTQKELSSKVGVSYSTVSGIESGKDAPSGKLAAKLADAVGVSQLFGLRPCPCGECDVLTVGGVYAQGHYSRDPDRCRRVGEFCREAKLSWWAARRSRGDWAGTKPRRGDVKPCLRCAKTYYVGPTRLRRKNGGRFCSASCSTRYRWEKGLISMALIGPLWSGRARQRWKGRWGGSKGAEFGIRGFHHGSEGGAPPKSTPQEAAEVWRLHKEENLSPRRIAERVFGNQRFHMRVRRILRVS